MIPINGFVLYLWASQLLVWLALCSSILRLIPGSPAYGKRISLALAFLLIPVWVGHNALFYLAGWFGMASVPTLAVALHALRFDGKRPLPTSIWVALALVNTLVLVPFLTWPLNGYEWGYTSLFSLVLLGLAVATYQLRQCHWFWLSILVLLAWLAWPGTSRNGFNYLVDGMMLVAAPCILITRLVKTGWRGLHHKAQTPSY